MAESLCLIFWYCNSRPLLISLFFFFFFFCCSLHGGSLASIGIKQSIPETISARFRWLNILNRLRSPLSHWRAFPEQKTQDHHSHKNKKDKECILVLVNLFIITTSVSNPHYTVRVCACKQLLKSIGTKHIVYRIYSEARSSFLLSYDLIISLYKELTRFGSKSISLPPSLSLSPPPPPRPLLLLLLLLLSHHLCWLPRHCPSAAHPGIPTPHPRSIPHCVVLPTVVHKRRRTFNRLHSPKEIPQYCRVASVVFIDPLLIQHAQDAAIYGTLLMTMARSQTAWASPPERRLPLSSSWPKRVSC